MWPNFRELTKIDSFCQHRTSRLLQSVAARLQKHTKTLGSFGAWNRCLNHLLTLAESHIESVILAKFIDAVQKYVFDLFLYLTVSFSSLFPLIGCIIMGFSVTARFYGTNSVTLGVFLGIFLVLCLFKNNVSWS